MTPTAVSLYRPDDTGGAAHSCAAGHTTCDKVMVGCKLIREVLVAKIKYMFLTWNIKCMLCVPFYFTGNHVTGQWAALSLSFRLIYILYLYSISISIF